MWRASGLSKAIGCCLCAGKSAVAPSLAARSFAAALLAAAALVPVAALAEAIETATCSDRFDRLDSTAWALGTMGQNADLGLYRHLTGKGGVAKEYDDRRKQSGGTWEQRLSLLDLRPKRTTTPDYRETGCNYVVAVSRFDERAERLGRDHPYMTVWAKNQLTVFENCEGPKKPVILPAAPPAQPPEAADLAAADFAYQTASAYFYAGEWPSAIAAFSAIYGDRKSPYHGLAGYMTARSLMYAKKPLDAAAKIREVINDPSAADVQVMARTFADVIAYRSYNPQLLTEQLAGIVEMLEMPAEKTAVSDELVRRYEQSVADLPWFIRRPGRDSPLDWWLGDIPLESGARSEASRVMARRSDLVDWLLTMSASRMFEQYGWYSQSSVEAKSAAYDAITRHAAEKWQKTGELYWAVALIKRAKPSDPEVPALMRQFHDARLRLTACADRFSDRPLYPVLFSNAVRLLATGGKVDEAIALLEPHAKRRYEHWIFNVYVDLFRWLVGEGDIASARRLDAMFADRENWRGDEGLPELRQIIARDLDEFVYRGGIDSDAAASAINLLPVEAMARILDMKGSRFISTVRLSRVAWTRAYLLNKTELLVSLTMKLRQLNRNLDPMFDRVDAASSEAARRNALTYILLETPRLGIRLNAQNSLLQSSWGEYVDDLFVTDGRNPNDNNWWCRFDPDGYRERLHRLFFELPVRPKSPWDRSYPHFDDAEMAAFRTIRDRVLADHPVLKLIDARQLEALSQIESGPAYLGRRALAWAGDKGWFFWLTGEDPLLPKTLHLAVRATRYGCRIDPQYGEISRAAFRILHKEYPDSPWTQVTPYWFGTLDGSSD